MYESIRIAASRRAAVHVVLVPAGAEAAPRGVDLDAAAKKAVKAALATPGFKGEPGEMLAAGEDVLVVGTGEADAVSKKSLRIVAARVVGALHRRDAKAATLHVAGIPAKQVDREAVGRALAEGLLLGNWRVDFFSGTAAKDDPAKGSLAVSSPDAKALAGLKLGHALATAANETRRFAASPPNVCHPEWIAKECRRLARSSGLKCRVISYAEAKRMGMGGIENVGKGSAVKPCMIVLEHAPAKAKKDVRLCLVGKTMSYDSGGYSLKLSGGMKGMKYDGNGGYAVLGTMLALAALEVPVNVVGLLPCAENMVSEDAYRPDDIITMHNGVTVEVTNTDAEGRLILADALSYACKTVKPTAIVDMATLTGGIVVALGKFSSGYFCNDDELCGRLEDASKAADEPTWRMPLWESHRDFMRAQHADLWNSAPARDAHPIQGAAFLSFFVDEDVPWAHVDIAGVSKVDADQPPYVAGPTGYGVRMLTDLVRGYA